MKLAPFFVATLVVAHCLSATLSGQRGQARGATQDSSPPVILDATQPHDKELTLDVVEVVGCLTDGPNNTFLLTSATAPVKGGAPSTTEEAIEAAKTKALGTASYVLIGLSEWSPADHSGHKMVVKGLMIKDATEIRLNVSSFQMIGETCAAN